MISPSISALFAIQVLFFGDSGSYVEIIGQPLFFLGHTTSGQRSSGSIVPSPSESRSPVTSTTMIAVAVFLELSVMVRVTVYTPGSA